MNEIDPAIEATKHGHKAETAMQANPDPSNADHVECDRILRSAFKTVPTSPAGIADIAALVLRSESASLDDFVRDALVSIETGARRMAV